MVTAYPVPTEEELNLQITYDEAQLAAFARANVNPYAFEVSIRNVINSGKSRVSRRIDTASSSIDLTGTPPGLYIITLSGHGKTFRRVFVKN